VWSGNRERHRLSRTGNRQLNAAIHRIAITQARCHDDAIAYLERRVTDPRYMNTKTEALRALKRRLSDVVYRALLADAQPAAAPADLLAAAA
jgi:ribosomal protein S4